MANDQTMRLRSKAANSRLSTGGVKKTDKVICLIFRKKTTQQKN